MSQWQAEGVSAHGSVMTFGLAADTIEEARARAQEKLPWEPVKLTLISIEPKCQPHNVRHPCKQEKK